MVLDRKKVLVICDSQGLSAHRARLLLQLLSELQQTALVADAPAPEGMDSLIEKIRKGEVRLLVTGSFEPPPDLALLDMRKMRPRKTSPFSGKFRGQYGSPNQAAERRYQIRMRKRRNRR